MRKFTLMPGLIGLLALLLSLSLTGCGGNGNPLWPDTTRDAETTEQSELVKNDPDGPIAGTQIPQELEQIAAKTEKEQKEAGLLDQQEANTLWVYNLEVISDDAPELVQPFTNISLLEKLRDTPPDSLTGLNQRIKSDLEESRSVLNAFGYYSGTAWSRIIPQRAPDSDRTSTQSKSGSSNNPDNAAENDGKPKINRRHVTVRVTFRPGERYKLGANKIIITDADKYPRPPTQAIEENAVAAMNIPLTENDSAEADKPGSKEQTAQPNAATESATGKKSNSTEKNSTRRRSQQPKQLNTLADVDLPDGSPAVAADVLDAVDRIENAMHDNGYPFAKVTGTRFMVDHDSKTLEAEIKVESGPLCYMGVLVVAGESNVGYKYLDAMRNWRTGRLWRQSRLENYATALRQTGLFQTVEIQPGETADENGVRQVVVKVMPAPERTISGALKYNSDFGAGIQASWQHRNFTGRGDRLNIDMPIWEDMQILSAQYRLPFFMDNSQDFVAQAAFRNEDVDAHKLTSLSAAAGLERRFSRRLSASLKGSYEMGQLETPDEPERDYYMVGMPLNVTYNGSNGLLDATEGFRLNLLASPYIGYYNDYFTVARGRLDATAYLPVVGKDKLVMAFRGTVGSVFGADSDDIPTTIRFYSGGGGSVRGYAYQSLGPRNSKDDPLGGSSLLEVSGEARYKASDSWGLVAFLDGGMVYTDASPELGKDLRWGAGLGFRYYTVIGPVRVDVATPLNKRDDDDSFQLYISIGQSF
ncbi:autotransporter assembly complex protein TamA [Desulfovibrio sp. OttesenSCG-928-C06]|nr:autotransporter assembly complex protein TamA [Desulfovibrio sp. OttesenSCG-928-C06]